jgi:hypothetical protein
MEKIDHVIPIVNTVYDSHWGVLSRETIQQQVFAFPFSLGCWGRATDSLQFCLGFVAIIR